MLGTALDGLSAMVITLPVALPLVLGAGFDKIWFGVFIVVTIELSNISPPVGFSLFVIQQLTGHSQTRVGARCRAVLPPAVRLRRRHGARTRGHHLAAEDDEGLSDVRPGLIGSPLVPGFDGSPAQLFSRYPVRKIHQTSARPRTNPPGRREAHADRDVRGRRRSSSGSR